MKSILQVILFSCLVSFTYAQSTTCCLGSTVAPEIAPGNSSTDVPLDVATPGGLSLAVQASSDLPNVEFLITKKNQLATTSPGVVDTSDAGEVDDVVIGTVDISGVFVPNTKNRYGVSLMVGDTIELTAVGYDLQLVKTLGDRLLNGSTSGQPCCGLFGIMALALNQPALAGFCDSVRNAGVNDSSDIQSMDDVLDIFNSFIVGQLSITSMVDALVLTNSSGTYINADCGGTSTNDFLPFGINKSQRYGYRMDNSVAVKELSDVTNYVIFPNPTPNKMVNISFTTSRTTDLSISIYNSVGQNVKSVQLGQVNGNINTPISLNALDAGMYLIELTDGQRTITQSLIVR